MKIVVIGGSGLIGSKLVSKLSEHGLLGVELGTGRLVVSGEAFTDEAVRAAVDDAGYELVA
jgi:uncharacterized protein YbjT (DUF2867 family)